MRNFGQNTNLNISKNILGKVGFQILYEAEQFSWLFSR